MSSESNERQLLARGMASLGLEAGNDALDQLEKYAAELRKWNRSYNLVSSADLEHLVTRHLLDSLSIHPFLKDGSLLDVGTGAGFPGLPLAVVKPDMEFTLLDSAGKKVRFLNHIDRTLGLGNIRTENCRVSGFHPESTFENICSRAFSSLTDFASAVRHLAEPETQLVAMKGQHPEAELDALPDWLEVSSIEKISVPGLHAERHLVIMSVPR